MEAVFCRLHYLLDFCSGFGWQFFQVLAGLDDVLEFGLLDNLLFQKAVGYVVQHITFFRRSTSLYKSDTRLHLHSLPVITGRDDGYKIK